MYSNWTCAKFVSQPLSQSLLSSLQETRQDKTNLHCTDRSERHASYQTDRLCSPFHANYLLQQSPKGYKGQTPYNLINFYRWFLNNSDGYMTVTWPSHMTLKYQSHDPQISVTWLQIILYLCTMKVIQNTKKHSPYLLHCLCPHTCIYYSVICFFFYFLSSSWIVADSNVLVCWIIVVILHIREQRGSPLDLVQHELCQLLVTGPHTAVAR